MALSKNRRACGLLEVNPLLRALILALLEEPLAYDRAGRAGRIAVLTLHELLFLTIPALYPYRLAAICLGQLVRHSPFMRPSFFKNPCLR